MPTSEHQMLTVIIATTDPNRARFLNAQMELDALVRRMSFEIVLQGAGTLPHAEHNGQGPKAYQVTGKRLTALGDEGIAAVKREIADLVYVYGGLQVWLGFGSIEHADV